MTTLQADWIASAPARKVCGMLTGAGHRALFVGGCVRNELLGAAVSDIDIATDALPERVMTLAGEAGFHAVPTGIGHGTVTVVADRQRFEVTTFRRDVETDGRRAVVEFTDSLEADARRRDFTMNALYATPDGEILDPLGGIDDLRDRRVRFIEDADARIREDYLRILRFFRFHAWHGDPGSGLDPEGLAACAALSGGLETLARERIGVEMLKLLAAPDPAPALSAMRIAGCLEPVLPGADSGPLALLAHLEAGRGTAPEPVRRLAVLGGESPGKHLRLSGADRSRRGLIRSNALGTAPPEELAYRHGRDAALDAMLARAALSGQSLPDNLDQALDSGAKAVFPISAADLMPEFAGPELGAKLAGLEAEWIASGFELTRNDLLDDG